MVAGTRREEVGAAEIDLRDSLLIIRKRRWIIITFLVIVLTAVTLGSLVIRPTYRATTTLLIEKEPNILSFEDVFSIDSSQETYYQTQYKLIQSRSLARNVIERLKLDQIEEFGFDPSKAPKASSNPAADAGRITGIVNSFQSRLEVEPIRQTRLVKVSFKARDAALAAKVVNTLTDTFIEMSIENKFEATEQASAFLSQQIDGLRAEITQMERQQQEYSSKKSIIALSDKETTMLEKLGDLNRALTEAQIERVRKESLYKQIASAKADSLQDVSGSEVFKRLKEDYARLEREYKKKSEIFKAEYPEMIALKAGLDNARRSIEGEVRNLVNSASADYQAALKKERSLSSMFDALKSEAGQLNSDAIQYNSLKIEVDNKKQLLESLFTRQSETGISARLKGMRTSNIRIVDRAETPLTPSSPKLKLNVLIALFLGLAGGLGLAFLFEHLDNSVKTNDEIERLIGLPSLGVIPTFCPTSNNNGHYSRRGSPQKHLKQGRAVPDQEPASIELIPVTAPMSNLSECYRAIRTSILLTPVDHPRRALVVTSALPSEGKSVTVANLAVSLTQADKTVLLLDLDLRKPRLHKIFEIRNANGLTNYLTSDLGIDILVKQTKIPGLSLVNSGPTPPNPSELLHSPKMAMLIQNMHARFDYILIDTPPILVVTDALIIGPQTDGILLVVWGGKTTREALKRVREKMDLVQVPSVGVVLNNLDLQEHDYYYKHHYYYYHDQDRRLP